MVDLVSAAPLGLGSMAQLATGSFVSTGNAASLVLGFTARHIRIFNETDNTTWEKAQGMTPANSFKEVAGVGTVDTTSAVTIPIDGGLNEPGSTVLLSAALCGTGKVISFAVYG